MSGSIDPTPPSLMPVMLARIKRVTYPSALGFSVVLVVGTLSATVLASSFSGVFGDFVGDLVSPSFGSPVMIPI